MLQGVEGVRETAEELGLAVSKVFSVEGLTSVGGNTQKASSSKIQRRNKGKKDLPKIEHKLQEAQLSPVFSQLHQVPTSASSSSSSTPSSSSASSSSASPSSSSVPSATSTASRIRWEELPTAVNPSAGDLSDERADRKRDQVENLYWAISAIAKEGDTIVDFCSGGV